ncbi:MAG: hypothetical protein JEY71_11895 [Sphaerochaeta sp.]|nr:hypothetical protein [Sphaerochaeta sp.]
MKKVVGLNGRSNCGKSRTLYLLGKCLIEKGYSINRGYSIKNKKEMLTKDFFSDNPRKNDGESCDFRAVFSFENQTVGIATQGDHPSEIRESIKFFKNDPVCDFVFSASRPNKEMKKLLEKFQELIDNKENLEWEMQQPVDQVNKELMDSRNSQMIQKLFGMIE